MVGIEWGSIEWGTAGEWFGGIGGFLAVAVAVGFGLVEYRRANTARADAKADSERAELAEQRQLEAERREKASRIRIEPGTRVDQAGDLPTMFTATIHNTGENLFTNVVAVACRYDGSELSNNYIGNVPPRSDVKAEVGLGGPERPADLVWRLDYTDVYGVHWSQSSGGIPYYFGDEDPTW